MRLRSRRTGTIQVSIRKTVWIEIWPSLETGSATFLTCEREARTFRISSMMIAVKILKRKGNYLVPPFTHSCARSSRVETNYSRRRENGLSSRLILILWLPQQTHAHLTIWVTRRTSIRFATIRHCSPHIRIRSSPSSTTSRLWIARKAARAAISH